MSATRSVEIARPASARKTRRTRTQLPLVNAKDHQPLPSHPDADLLTFGQEWAASTKEIEILEKQYEAAEKEFMRIKPEIPEALYVQGGDDEIGLRSVFNGSERWYVNEEIIHAFRSLSCPKAQDRIDEILAAYDLHKRKTNAASEMTGYGKLREQYCGHHAHNRGLRRRIAVTPAHTPEGADLKLRVAAWCIGDDPNDWHPSIEKDCGTAETLSLSYVFDLMCLAQLPHPDAELLRLGKEYDLIWNRANAPDIDDDDLAARCEELKTIEYAIQDIPARALAGLAVKARVAKNGKYYEAYAEGSRSIVNMTPILLDEILRLAGGAHV